MAEDHGVPEIEERQRVAKKRNIYGIPASNKDIGSDAVISEVTGIRTSPLSLSSFTIIGKNFRSLFFTSILWVSVAHVK